MSKPPLISRSPLALILLAALLLAACSPAAATPTLDRVGTAVALTLTAGFVPSDTPTPEPPASTPPPPTGSPTLTATASSTPTETATPTPTEQAFSLTGRVCFPGGSIPAMTLYFENLDTEQVTELPVQVGQDHYEVNLPPGEYQAYAWLLDFSYGGLFSKAVNCGSGSNCDDHTPQTFVLEAGDRLQGVDICDWYAGPFNIPYPPGVDQAVVTGSISGAISFPGGNPPAFKVVAFNQNTGNWVYVTTNPGQTSYTIAGLHPGIYQIAAYGEDGNTGGHPAIVTVQAGERTVGIDITDWGGNVPPDPTR